MTRNEVLSVFTDKYPCADDVDLAITRSLYEWCKWNNAALRSDYSKVRTRTETLIVFECDGRRLMVGTGDCYTAAARDLCTKLWSDIDTADAA